MATGKKRKKATAPPKEQMIEKLKQFIRTRGQTFLQDRNVSSVGIGYKETAGKTGKELALQFTVDRKAAPDMLESLGTAPIPEVIVVDGVEVPTDVIQRSFTPSYKIVSLQEKLTPSRKNRIDPISPGVSVAHHNETAGTIGCVVYDKHDGTPYVLSNWHVLHGAKGNIGDTIVQPGPFDDNRVKLNRLGKLVRSHVGAAGDCAVASIEDRAFDATVFETGVQPALIGEPELGDKLLKSGRTTGVTHGVVTRVHTMVKIDYGEGVGECAIGGFEIGPDGANLPPNGEISMGGDSGAVWLLKTTNGKPSNVMAGLHFAGEGATSVSEYALACYAKSVFEKLEISFAPPAAADAAEALGYLPNFLGPVVTLPKLNTANTKDVFKLNNSPHLHYTHFSLALSQARRLAIFVAWNVDGKRIKKLSSRGIKFALDPRVPAKYQVGDELYSGNRLDRGHIARRADLVWGGDAEAKKANVESFLFPNIAPQMDNFNQSNAGGIWGKLEDAVFEEVDVKDLRISVFGGPVFKKDDREYRGVKIPREFFKVLAYMDGDKLKAKAFLLTQNLSQLELLDLSPFKVYQVTLAEVEKRCGFAFPANLKRADAFPERLETLESEEERPPLQGLEDIAW